MFFQPAHCDILMLLDLTAFDTEDRQILLFCLENWVDIHGAALEWFRYIFLKRELLCLSDILSPLLCLLFAACLRALYLALFFSLCTWFWMWFPEAWICLCQRLSNLKVTENNTVQTNSWIALPKLKHRCRWKFYIWIWLWQQVWVWIMIVNLMFRLKE